MYDFTYVENVAHGHICAEKALALEDCGTKAAGQVLDLVSSFCIV